jgi:hypoxanthine phosphoribosyltransferase
MKVLFENRIIEARIEFLATQIINRHKSEKIPIVLVCVLNGGFVFYAKLAEKLSSLDPECDFIKVKSYEGQERGKLEVKLRESIDIENHHVYIIDDIYDTGVTMDSLRKHFIYEGAASVQIVTLIKRAINEIDLPSGSIYGFEITDEWVVGYGMDDEHHQKRSLPYILAV